jgi:hypothetical protein
MASVAKIVNSVVSFTPGQVLTTALLNNAHTALISDVDTTVLSGFYITVKDSTLTVSAGKALIQKTLVTVNQSTNFSISEGQDYLVFLYLKTVPPEPYGIPEIRLYTPDELNQIDEGERPYLLFLGYVDESGNVLNEYNEGEYVRRVWSARTGGVSALLSVFEYTASGGETTLNLPAKPIYGKPGLMVFKEGLLLSPEEYEYDAQQVQLQLAEGLGKGEKLIVYIPTPSAD